ncbi:MAG: ferritin-like domain-containing protein [Planctomycetaceae bacterium]
MLVSDFARRILLSPEMAEKLSPVAGPLDDAIRPPALRVTSPARPPNLQICGRREAPAMPPPGSFGDPGRRAIAHHIMANHELQALEVMAFVLLAFPEAPGEFRQGLVRVMHDEQRHTQMHIDRLAGLGMRFGDLRVNGYFWKKAQQFTSLLDYVAGMSLTFEGRNLDHTLEFAEWFRQAGDEQSAGVMRAIHRDEIRHVAFGMHWLRALKPANQTEWDAYESHLKWPLRPEKSRGQSFHREPRLEAGMTAEFVDRLQGLG